MQHEQVTEDYCCHAAHPIPELPPVTIAVFPERYFPSPNLSITCGSGVNGSGYKAIQLDSTGTQSSS